MNNTSPTLPTDSQSRLQAIIDSAIDGIITIDERGIVESMNPAAAKMFGYAPQEVIGYNINQLMPEPYSVQHDQYLKNYCETRVRKIIGIGREVMGLRKDGTMFPFMLSVAEVVLQKENRRIFTGIIHDITDKVLAEEVQKALEKERELSELKSRFISIASHEFRTPLTTISTSATLISKYADEKGQKRRLKHVDRIKASVKHLTNILNDFLSLSKLEEGHVKAQPEQFNLKQFILDVREEMQTVAKSNQIIKHTHLGEEQNAYLDQKLLHGILINLLSNAIKYSNSDQTIYLLTSISTTQVKISVRDEGMGIPESEKKQLFTRFFRASNASNIQGTGLGLNIVKRYVDLMKGRIECKSELEKGTTFTLYFDVSC